MHHPAWDSLVKHLSKLISYDTTSCNTNMKLIGYVHDVLMQSGIEPIILPNESHTKASVIARIGPNKPGGVILSGHTDVVPVDGQLWDTDPFLLSEKEDRFYGRGTSDMKSFLASILAMIPEWKDTPLKAPIYLAFSYDEEVGCLAAPSLVQHIVSLGYKPEFAIIGEPTLMTVMHQHKGVHVFSTEVTGVEAHSSQVDKGVNAIALAAEIVLGLQHIATSIKVDVVRQSIDYDPPYTTIHVGQIEGGTAHNIIPRHCRFVWEIRSISEADQTWIMEQFTRLTSAITSKHRQFFPEVGISTTLDHAVPGLVASEGNNIAKLVAKLARTNEIHAAAFATEAGIFQQHGIPSIILGPGSIQQAHKPNEWIAKSQIEDCLVFLSRVQQYLSN